MNTASHSVLPKISRIRWCKSRMFISPVNNAPNMKILLKKLSGNLETRFKRTTTPSRLIKSLTMRPKWSRTTDSQTRWMLPTLPDKPWLSSRQNAWTEIYTKPSKKVSYSRPPTSTPSSTRKVTCMKTDCTPKLVSIRPDFKETRGSITMPWQHSLTKRRESTMGP